MIKAELAQNKADMLKTVCTVTFLVVLLSLWGCAHGSPLHAKRHQEDDKTLSWMRTCGHDIDSRLNDTSIVKGKNQKKALYESSLRFMFRYIVKLNKTTQVIEERELMDDLGELPLNTMPAFRANYSSFKTAHRDLQVYIAIFSKIWENRRSSNQGFVNHKAEVLHELNLLKHETQHWLCIVEDMLNGTDHLRIKTRYLKQKILDKKVDNIIGQEKFTKYLKMSLSGIEKYAENFFYYVKGRLTNLINQQQLRKKLRQKKNCSKKNRCKNRQNKNGKKQKNRLMKKQPDQPNP